MPKPKQLELIVLSDSFAIIRLPPDAAVPQWATGSFVSITRTTEELSIVYPQRNVSPNITTTTTEWTCFQIRGPLDFAWTGILASLAHPLSETGISIFAMSTYDTDYILVQKDKAAEAAAVFQRQGHIVSYQETSQDKKQITTTTTTKPRDGPATAFVADPFVAALVEHKLEESSSSSSSSSTFGLVVVAGWPPKREQWFRNYAAFIAAVQMCFDEPDVSFESKGHPAVYFYPFAALHTTVATLRSFTLPDLSETQKTVMIEQWTRVVERATQNALWPQQNLRLKIESAQLGAKAGILLWRETTGGFAAMRACLKQAVNELSNELSNVETFAMPEIIHSTFCRLTKVPRTHCAAVQERFQRDVLPQLSCMFPSSISVSSVSLVCERTPYMHVPNDLRHVLFRVELE